MNKVSLVTLWVEPKSKQIVKYIFDNVHFDFLPAAWLVRMEELQASMTMSQPFKDVWLPRDVDFHSRRCWRSGRSTSGSTSTTTTIARPRPAAGSRSGAARRADCWR